MPAFERQGRDHERSMDAWSSRLFTIGSSSRIHVESLFQGRPGDRNQVLLKSFFAGKKKNMLIDGIIIFEGYNFDVMCAVPGASQSLELHVYCYQRSVSSHEW